VNQVASRSPSSTSDPRLASSSVRAGHGTNVQLKRALRETSGFAAQSELLSPVQMLPAFGLMSGLRAGVAGGAGAGQGEATERGEQDTAKENTQDAASDKVAEAARPEDAGAAAATPDMPRDFGQESVLATWIGEFNKSLAKRVVRGKNPKLDQLKRRGWADDNGLSLDLLKEAAKTWEAPGRKKAKTNGQDAGEQAAPAPVTTAKVLAMLASVPSLLNKVISADYPAKCLQFSEKMMVEIGAKRADGSDRDREKRSARAGPLTARYRGKPTKELPKDLPPGYQICVLSRPDWQFTEVGNHWFISAGDGLYLDNHGVHTGGGITSLLIGTTGDQWASRVVDNNSGLRKRMGEKFVQENPRFRQYEKVAGEPEEQQARVAIKAFVKATPAYHPQIWVVEPTKSNEAGSGEG
jgi:hypothetical protein